MKYTGCAEGACLLGASLLPYPNPKQGVEQWLKHRCKPGSAYELDLWD